MAETPNGYLVLTAIEATGRDKDDVYVRETVAGEAPAPEATPAATPTEPAAPAPAASAAEPPALPQQ